jgi:hypothetical protein
MHTTVHDVIRSRLAAQRLLPRWPRENEAAIKQHRTCEAAQASINLISTTKRSEDNPHHAHAAPRSARTSAKKAPPSLIAIACIAAA